MDSRPKKFTPEDLTNELIQYVGDEYYQRHGGKRKFPHTLFHNNFDLADQLKHYHANSDSRHKWLFLADIYSKLPNHHGEIASVIRQLFSVAFRENIGVFKHHTNGTETRSMKELSNAYLAVANDYFFGKSYALFKSSK